MPKRQSYWDKRAIKAEKRVNDGAKRTEEVVIRAYRQAQHYLTNKVKKLFTRATARSGMTEEELSIVLNRQTPVSEIVELTKLAKDISNPEIKKQAQKRLNALSFKERITRAEDLKAKSYLVSKQVADVQLNTATDFYIDTIHDSYKDTVAESYIRKLEQQGVTLEIWNKKAFEKSGHQFKELSTKYTQNILDSHWHGSNYSKRIWNDTDALARRLEELFTVESMTGMSEREMTKLIAKEFDRSIGVARRLIRTEANYMANQAKLKGWQDSGVKQYRLVAVLDLRTSKVCQSQDGEIYLVSEAFVNGVDGNYPPFHPFCRTIAIAYFGERSVKGEKKVNDPVSGETFILPRVATYDDWMNKLKEKYSSEEIDRQKNKIRNATSDNRSYRQMKELLGKENSPKSLEEYQDIKYNDGEQWKELKGTYRDVKWMKKAFDNHEVLNKSDTIRKPPVEAEPNSVKDFFIDERLEQRRYYGKTGKPRKDIDYSHHGNEKLHPDVPHVHDWTSYERDKKIVISRSKDRPRNLAEIIVDDWRGKNEHS